MKKNILPLCLLFLSLFLLSACETDEQRAIVKAQKCLNTTTVANAATCKDYLAGHTSREAYSLRCAADFMAEGVSAENMVVALERRDATGTTGNPLLGMMGVLAFRTEALAAEAKTDCHLSGYPSYDMLADMAVISSRLAAVAISAGTVTITLNPQSGEKPTQEEFQNALDSLTELTAAGATDETKEVIGEAAESVYANYCQAQNDTTKVCTTIGSAITGNTTTLEIGETLLTLLNQP